MIDILVDKNTRMGINLKCSDCGFLIRVDVEKYHKANYIQCPLCGKVIKYVPSYHKEDAIYEVLIARGYTREQSDKIFQQIQDILSKEKPKLNDLSDIMLESVKGKTPLITEETYKENKNKKLNQCMKECTLEQQLVLDNVIMCAKNAFNNVSTDIGRLESIPINNKAVMKNQKFLRELCSSLLTI